MNYGGSTISDDESSTTSADQQHVDREVLDPARFLDTGETAQVWAVDIRNGGFRYLPDGQAEDLRDVVREYWACPEPTCPAPESLIAVSVRKKRDHLRHHGASISQHQPQSLAHIQAIAMIAAWIEETYPEHEVQREQSLCNNRRRADVAVTWPGSDSEAPSRVAFEVEYKTEGERAWIEKNRDYEQYGIVGQWLFGHMSGHMNRRTSREDLVRLGDVPRALAERGRHVLMVNPWDRTIGTLVVEGNSPEADDQWWRPEKIDWVGRRLARGGDHVATVDVCRLGDCRLDPVLGLVTPVMDDIAVERTALAERAVTDEQAWREVQAKLLDAERARVAEEMPKLVRRQHPATSTSGSLRRPGWDPALAHCSQCAAREAKGLPVGQPSPGYRPWRDWDGMLVCDPPLSASTSAMGIDDQPRPDRAPD